MERLELAKQCISPDQISVERLLGAYVLFMIEGYYFPRSEILRKAFLEDKNTPSESYVNIYTKRKLHHKPETCKSYLPSNTLDENIFEASKNTAIANSLHRKPNRYSYPYLNQVKEAPNSKRNDG